MAKRRGRKLTDGIDVDRLNQLVLDLGVRVRVYKSTLMPDMKSLESMDQDINETISNNNMIDFDCVETIAMFQQQELVKQYQVHGTFHIDEIMVTFLSGQTLAPLSKIEVLDFEEDFYELIQRQEGQDFDVLKYPACDVLGIFTYNRTTSSRVRYHKGTDFTIDQNGNVKWTGTHRPTDREIYTIYYRHRPTFRAIKAIHRDRYSQYNLRPQDIQAPKTTVDGKTYVTMPETWIIKRDYLIRRRDLLGNVQENQYYDPNE